MVDNALPEATGTDLENMETAVQEDAEKLLVLTDDDKVRVE